MTKHKLYSTLKLKGLEVLTYEVGRIQKKIKQLADFALDIFYDLEEECSQEKVLYLERLSRLKGYQNKIEIVEFNKPSKEGKMPPKYLDGTYRVRGTSFEYRFTHDGKQVSVYGKSKEECWNKRTALIKGEVCTKKQPVVTFGNWLFQWFETYKIPILSKDTIRGNRNLIQKELFPEFEKKSLNKLATQEIDLFLSRYNDKKNKKYKLALLIKESLKKAYLLSLLKNDRVYLAIEMPTNKTESYRPLAFPEQEIVFMSIDNRMFQLFYKIMCCTGMRIGEFLALDFNAAIDYELKYIHVLHSRSGKTNEIKGTKTGKKRYIPFADSLATDLKEYTEFYNSNPNIWNSTISSYFTKLFKKLNMKNVVIHSFRHTFASVSYHIGINHKQIQQWLGHSTLDMTMNVYTDLIMSGNSFLKDYLIELKNSLNL